MYTFFGRKLKENRFLIEGEDLKHLRVRRIKIREKIGIIWEGSLFLCELTDINPKAALCKAIDIVDVEPPPVDITLIQSVPVELKTFELIVQKATELGVKKVVPLLTKRSFRKMETIERKRERFEKIVREAMKQSNRPYPMEIASPLDIEELEPTCDLSILLDNFEEGKRISDLPLKEVKSVEIVVGPEGGFTREERELLKGRGFLSVRLKPNILRTETASIVGVGIIVNLAGS